jgi:soluble lytic murein transglycosylase-like protein
VDGSDDPARRPDGLGVRGLEEERRHGDRRRKARHERERRRGDRRRARIRTLVMTAAALAAPHAVKLTGIAAGRTPTVTTSITSFNPIDATHAYDDLIQEAADTYKLDPAMIRAVMQTESAFNAMAVSPVGALGLMQLMPDVAEELGVTDPMDPRQNIMGGSLYLRRLLDTHKGDVKLALASYNAGPGNVAKYNAVPPFKETRNYIKRITGLLAEAKANNH